MIEGLNAKRIINDVDVRIEFFPPEKKSKAEQPRNMEFAQKDHRTTLVFRVHNSSDGGGGRHRTHASLNDTYFRTGIWYHRQVANVRSQLNRNG